MIDQHCWQIHQHMTIPSNLDGMLSFGGKVGPGTTAHHNVTHRIRPECNNAPPPTVQRATNLQMTGRSNVGFDDAVFPNGGVIVVGVG